MNPILTIDMGTTNVKGGLIDPQGNILIHTKVNLGVNHPSAIVLRLTHPIDEVLTSLGSKSTATGISRLSFP